jgi:hypothetical protein
LTDAREKFQRAYELKCNDKEMYKHWIRMETDEMEWSGACEAAEKGLQRLPNNARLQYDAGYAKSRLGRELAGGFHREKALEALSKADQYLNAALASAVPAEQYAGLRRDIHRARVLNWELLDDPTKVFEGIDAWRREHPNDPNLVSEEARLLTRFRGRSR